MPPQGLPVSTDTSGSAVLPGFLTLPGAVAGEGADAGVAAHYGNPLREQRTLAEDDAIVDLSHRAVLSVTGSDRLSWLHSITSQSLADLTPGVSTETLVLDPNGRIQHVARAIDDGETTWLLLEREQASGLLTWLQSMKFMLKVDVADRSAQFATIGMMGEPVLPVVQTGVELVWRDPWSTVAVGGHQYAGANPHPGTSWRWSEALVDRDQLPALAEEVASGAMKTAGLLAFEALRIAAWRPRFGAEVDARSIPHELDWLRSAVHLNKGCYRGQETVAKVHNLGHPPRRLVMLHLDGSEGVLASPGDEVALGDTVVGRVTSAGLHYELGPIALAIVKRTTDPGAVLTVNSGGTVLAAAQEVIVPTDAGATAGVPRLPRLGRMTRTPSQSG
ncbi:MAG: glycine cleavage T C-terminal barrel domain-containing protein [Terrimesophilobacter sp.]